jgi:hypothetical protein
LWLFGSFQQSGIYGRFAPIAVVARDPRHQVNAQRDRASCRKACLAETFDKPLIVVSPAAPGRPFGNAKAGLEFEQACCRLRSFCLAAQMNESRRETAKGRRKGSILTDSLPGRSHRLVKTTESNECDAHSCKPHEQCRCEGRQRQVSHEDPRDELDDRKRRIAQSSLVQSIWC